MAVTFNGSAVDGSPASVDHLYPSDHANCQPGVHVSKDGPSSVVQGSGNLTYTVTVNNTGTGPTSGTITVTDTIPGGTTLVTAGGTNNWTCIGTTSLSCTNPGRSLLAAVPRSRWW